MIPRTDIGLDGTPGDLVSRVDLHCHSSASAAPRLGVQRSLGLPECATPPEEVYELAKRRGMDFVTITDHDTIDGCMEIAARPDVFISEELTAWFCGEPQAVHVLCYGISPEEHELLQERAADVSECAAFLHERRIICALAHPFFAVAAPLGPRHRSRLAELFPVWEIRNGSRARELNMPAAVYIETRGGTGVGGSDDHAGVDIGRTWTETPPASTPEEFLDRLREGRAAVGGEQGSAAKWAHSALALATRAFGPATTSSKLGTKSRTAGVDLPDDSSPNPGTPEPEARMSPESLTKSRTAGVDLPDDSSPNPGTPEPEARMSPEWLFRMAATVVRDGNERGGEPSLDLGREQARALLDSWREALELSPDERPEGLIARMQGEGFAHAELERAARRAHERRLREAAGRLSAAAATRTDYQGAGRALFEACIPVVPYVPASIFLGSEKAKLAPRDKRARRAAIVVDGAGSMHGVTHTIERIREHGVPGWEVEVIGTDARVDRRLPAVAEIDAPFYPGLEMGVPSLADLCRTLAEGSYDLVHPVSPGPAGVGAAICARVARTPLVGSYHTELAAYAAIRTGDAALETGARLALALFYGQCDLVLSPSEASDRSLEGLGADPDRIARWIRGVDLSLYDPAKRVPESHPGEVRVLYAGRLAREKGLDLLADAFLRARERDPRLHLLLAGGGPDEGWLRERLERGLDAGGSEGDALPATFLGWLDRDQLAQAYASADVFLFCSRTDTYGQVIAEAQASGLPVVAVAEGGPASLVRDGQTGWLCPPDAESLAGAVCQLAASRFLRERLSRAALAEGSGRTWERALEQLAAGYERTLARAGSGASLAPKRLAA